MPPGDTIVTPRWVLLGKLDDELLDLFNEFPYTRTVKKLILVVSKNSITRRRTEERRVT